MELSVLQKSDSVTINNTLICIHYVVEHRTSKGENEILGRRKLHFENVIVCSLVRENSSELGARTQLISFP